MKNYKLNRLKYRVEFGNYEEIDSPEPNATGDFEPELTVWCGKYNQTTDQRIRMESGGILTDELQPIVIRHQDVTPYLMARFESVLYKVQSVDSDDSLNGFDVVTLKRWHEDE